VSSVFFFDRAHTTKPGTCGDGTADFNTNPFLFATGPNAKEIFEPLVGGIRGVPSFRGPSNQNPRIDCLRDIRRPFY
jgi:hypothetical protein